jgi:hypothetical protein
MSDLFADRRFLLLAHTLLNYNLNYIIKKFRIWAENKRLKADRRKSSC